MRKNYQTIEDALCQPVSQLFYLKRVNGQFTSGDPESLYSCLEPDEHLTFDIANNKVLVNMAYNGVIKYISLFRGDYLSDSGSHWPGVWVNRDFTKFGPYSFSFSIGETLIDLSDCSWDYKTSLLDNIFPITKYTGRQMTATVLCYTPISEEGHVRPKGVIYGLQLTNTSEQTLTGTVYLPRLFGPDNVASSTIEAGLRCYCDLSLNLLDDLGTNALQYCLKPGQNIWVPVLLSAFGEDVFDEINSRGSLYWLNTTWSYFRDILGDLDMPGDIFAAACYERSMLQCFASIGMDGSGIINGSSWGSYPTTRQIWMKDLFYTCLPFAFNEPELFCQNILWFIRYSLRPKGSSFTGGISHSVSVALAPVIMAGLYYDRTGDKKFFLQNPQIHDRITQLLDMLIQSRNNKDTWMFTSQFISDGLSASDYNTGTQVCVWFAFKSFARILMEVYDQPERASEYENAALMTKNAVDAHNIIVGPFGRQYIEGTDLDGTVPWMGHEGEESDTTLMSLYGYVAYDNPAYKNYTRFALSEYNRAYNPVTRGIRWGTTLDPLPVPATFPGYLTGFVNAVDAQTMSGSDGYLTQIRKLTDIDGSFWWWPYLSDSESKPGGQQNHRDIHADCCTSRPVRMNIAGKCGWAAGLYACLFISQILGLNYDAPTKTLKLRPFSPTSNFTWNRFRLGSAWFSAKYSMDYHSVCVELTNLNTFPVQLELQVILTDSKKPEVEINSKTYNGPHQLGEFLGKPSISISSSLEVSEIIVIKIR